MKSDEYLYLYELEDNILEYILDLPEQELADYIHILIARFYGHTEKGSSTYLKLFAAYHSSFLLEKAYRAETYLNSNYTAIYTKTGLIRELVSDLYSIGKEKLAIH